MLGRWDREVRRDGAAIWLTFSFSFADALIARLTLDDRLCGRLAVVDAGALPILGIFELVGSVEEGGSIEIGVDSALCNASVSPGR